MGRPAQFNKCGPKVLNWLSTIWASWLVLIIITQWSRVVGKLIIAQLVKKIFAFYGSVMYIILQRAYSEQATADPIVS
jgi:hypothetical protein